jgi:hypothetical protein
MPFTADLTPLSTVKKWKRKMGEFIELKSYFSSTSGYP